MKYVPAHIYNIHGVTPTEEVPLVSDAEKRALIEGGPRPVSAQLDIKGIVPV